MIGWLLAWWLGCLVWLGWLLGGWLLLGLGWIGLVWSETPRCGDSCTVGTDPGASCEQTGAGAAWTVLFVVLGVVCFFSCFCSPFPFFSFLPFLMFVFLVFVVLCLCVSPIPSAQLAAICRNRRPVPRCGFMSPGLTLCNFVR